MANLKCFKVSSELTVKAILNLTLQLRNTNCVSTTMEMKESLYSQQTGIFPRYYVCVYSALDNI